jgi:hypothetical protein
LVSFSSIRSQHRDGDGQDTDCGSGQDDRRQYRHVHRFRAGRTHAYRGTLGVLRRALEDAGVEFIDENGGDSGRTAV